MTPLPISTKIKRRRLSSIEEPLFESAWTLYEASFSIDERRMIDDHKKVMDHPFYHFEILILEEGFLGILLWWQFEHLRYVEHFSISDAHKSKGYGSLVLRDFQSEHQDPILLEVGKPEGKIQQRRISFYQRLGFYLSPYQYIQPAYSKIGNPIPLLLMSWPTVIDHKTQEYFTKDCHLILFGKRNP